MSDNNSEKNTEEKITIPSSSIDKLTLECLMNRTQYKKYIEKTDPTKFSENETQINKLKKYGERIITLTSDLLDNPEMMITLDVNEMFDSYSRTLIRYFETKDMEKDDIDTLFDKMDEEDDNTNNYYSNKNTLPSVPFRYTKSYWGKDKVLKRSIENDD